MAIPKFPKCYLKELSDVLLNCPSRYVCSMLDRCKTSVSEKVVNQRAFMINHEFYENLSHDDLKGELVF